MLKPFESAKEAQAWFICDLPDMNARVAGPYVNGPKYKVQECACTRRSWASERWCSAEAVLGFLERRFGSEVPDPQKPFGALRAHQCRLLVGGGPGSEQLGFHTIIQ